MFRLRCLSVTNVQLHNSRSVLTRELHPCTFDLQENFSEGLVKPKDNSILKNQSAHHSQNGNVKDVYPSKIVVEFSSPNIAKPFHVGHLRSTIIGNFLANLNEHLSNNVVRINYLGDWGTQFGLLKVGVDISGYTKEMIKENPLELLCNAYVLANKEAETNPSIAKKAREVFQQLEEGSIPDLEDWETFRAYSIEELQKAYQRLGVTFNEYHWESSYSAKNVGAIINILEAKGILKLETDGKKVVKLSETQRCPVIKSDGSTLYLTRDIAAAVDRFQRHKFDQMYYVVDNSQTDHFSALFKTLSRMEFPWSDRMKHVKFGRIHGMSTRRGNVVLLKDILDEARDIMHRKQHQSKTTKVILGAENDNTADVLGISAVVVNDLKQRRQNNYVFNWENALKMEGDSGISLQYTHCRLGSLEHNCGCAMAAYQDPAAVGEPLAVALREHVAQFDAVLRQAQAQAEACVLVNYLFRLCRLTNKAFKALQVKGQGEFLASQRLLMFHQAKDTLSQGMHILGLRPLERM